MWLGLPDSYNFHIDETVERFRPRTRREIMPEFVVRNILECLYFHLLQGESSTYKVFAISRVNLKQHKTEIKNRKHRVIFGYPFRDGKVTLCHLTYVRVIHYPDGVFFS